MLSYLINELNMLGWVCRVFLLFVCLLVSFDGSRHFMFFLSTFLLTFFILLFLLSLSFSLCLPQLVAQRNETSAVLFVLCCAKQATCSFFSPFCFSIRVVPKLARFFFFLLPFAKTY
jgi:uncharacterized membrane protein